VHVDQRAELGEGHEHGEDLHLGHGPVLDRVRHARQQSSADDPPAEPGWHEQAGERGEQHERRERAAQQHPDRE